MHRHTVSRSMIALAVLGLAATSAFAGDAEHEGRSFDARVSTNEGFEVPTSPAQHAALEAMRASGLDLVVTHDAATGATRSLYNRTGYLAGEARGEALAIALAFARGHRRLLGLEAADLDATEVTDVVYSAVSGASHVYLRQTHLGLPVLGGQLHVNVNRDGRIVSLNNAFLPALAAAAGASDPTLGAVGAVSRAAAHLGLEAGGLEVAAAGPGPVRATTVLAPRLSARDVEARLAWLPVRRGEARLVWSFQLWRPAGDHIYDLTVDAHTGQVWTRFDWVAADSYRAFEQPTESPIHSALPPPADGRLPAANPADPTASPLGWHDDGTTGYTVPRGNNVHAFDDVDGNSSPPAVEPDCGATLDCDFHFPIDFGTADPLDYTDASVVNLFYWTNLVHDIEYQYGFDEAAGNFQENNFGNGGLGGDHVRALAQKSGPPCPNNAFFGTPPEGGNPSQIMCLFTPPTPRRDFSWDAGIIVHEYGHGISNRLVGGPSNTSCLQNLQQPGEGLSDWWGLTLIHEAGDQGTDLVGSGTYVLGQPPNGPGVRPQPYSTDPAINSYTYASIGGLSIPHGVGSVWAQVAWEAYWALVDHHGFDSDLHNALGGSGNQRMKLYVIEGLKNTICSPAFTDVRDGIIQAAVDNYGGGDVCRLWQAFADFGLGTDATSGGPNSTAASNGFEIPVECALGEIFADGFESGDTSAW